MKVRFSAKSDVGLSRQFNEDAFLVDERLGLFMVADGMGGSAGGEVASRMACDVVHKHLVKNIDVIRRFDSGGKDVEPKAVSDLIVGGIQLASATVRAGADADPKLQGMGTTLVVLLVAGEHLFIAHVGDSRLYLLRQGTLYQVTRDHSLVEELKKRGKIASAQQVKAKFRNAITRAVGVYDTVQVDTLEMVPLQDDRFLLCTDGLHSTASDDELARLVGAGALDEVADNLVRHANSMGGKDNITVVVADVAEIEAERAAQTQKKLATLMNVPLFRYLTFDEMLKVVSAIEEKMLATGTVIFNEGDPGDALYILLSGEVAVTKANILIATLGSGNHFGELALIDQGPRSARCAVTKSSYCLVMSRAKFYELIREQTALAVKLLWSLAKVISMRLRQTTDELGLARALVAQLEPTGGNWELEETLEGVRKE